ncbi:hypothetical protein PUNSTDRAFT_42632 [Punctularia strigosozonata HHB-11173 SS5]|uniref:uncharacterized protein n=1 Tax=Punctularia strigosozonata (strain HHB-11173) TaxID=741275 RepID=UPI00044175C2|nr:uncharacterized protein PUNSTDRAFT_42632 [Punctularia strigosozonata HHB-11173 SS5]EIN11339.1 hypothetical protein PUNSTDRAFT_42632 [Punctularia strigosozonata HHB-11173 SS5]
MQPLHPPGAHAAQPAIIPVQEAVEHPHNANTSRADVVELVPNMGNGADTSNTGDVNASKHDQCRDRCDDRRDGCRDGHNGHSEGHDGHGDGHDGCGSGRDGCDSGRDGCGDEHDGRDGYGGGRDGCSGGRNGRGDERDGHHDGRDGCSDEHNGRGDKCNGHHDGCDGRGDGRDGCATTSNAYSVPSDKSQTAMAPSPALTNISNLHQEQAPCADVPAQPAKSKQRRKPTETNDADLQKKGTRTPARVPKTPSKTTVKTETKMPVKAAPKGLGAKSGKNVRKGGESDEDIKEMDPEMAKQVLEGTESNWSKEDTKILVDYICREDVFEDFKLKKDTHTVKIAQDLLNNRKTATQVKSRWKYLFRKYMAARRLEEHTGGGDGDESEMEALGSDMESKVGVKRPLSKSSSSQWSRETLEEFRDSYIYMVIDTVAHDHPEVVCDDPLNEATSLSDSEESSIPPRKCIHREGSEEDMLKSLVDSINARTKSKTKLEERELQIREAQAKHEEELHRIRVQELELQQWVKVKEFLESPVAAVQEFGKRLAAQLDKRKEGDRE